MACLAFEWRLDAIQLALHQTMMGYAAVAAVQQAVTAAY
jgi:hypothetical protein